ncbi:MAG: hypothetical protein COA78_25900 [Blastopirellula sp.]|nr:MAG: hypothetical protein COA78_25900 [Blastopirellula sp.]
MSTYRKYAQLIVASVLLCTFVLQAGAMSCGCADHNFWSELATRDSCSVTTNVHHEHHQHDLIDSEETHHAQFIELNSSSTHSQRVAEVQFCSCSNQPAQQCDHQADKPCLTRKDPTLTPQPLEFCFSLKTTDCLAIKYDPQPVRIHTLAQWYSDNSQYETISVYLL